MATSTSSAPPVRGRFDWLWRGGPSFVAPDGSRLSLSGTALDVSRPWSCGFFALVRGSRRSFSVAETGAFDWHSTYTTIPDEILRQPYRGGELLVGSRYQAASDEPTRYRAAWRGQWFELHTRSSGPPPSGAEIVRIFDAFRLTDTPLGMLVQARTARHARLEPVQVAKDIPGFGHLTIERPESSQIEIPEFRGFTTRHGELWRQPLGNAARGRSRPEALVLATPTAITRLVAGPTDSTDPSTALDFLADLNVTWEPA
ncbi:MAG: hypothetical protein ACRDTC_27090 [Pseudonocardiaceae bacterium]